MVNLVNLPILNLFIIESIYYQDFILNYKSHRDGDITQEKISYAVSCRNKKRYAFLVTIKRWRNVDASKLAILI